MQTLFQQLQPFRDLLLSFLFLFFTMPGTAENGAKTGKGRGRGRPPAAAKQPVVAEPPQDPSPVASDDEIESACGDETLATGTGGRKRNYSDAYSGEMQSLLSSFGADLSRSLNVKKSRMENYTQLAVKTSSKKVKEMWQAQQVERTKLNSEYSKQMTTVFSQWEDDLKRAKESEEQLQSMFKQQQKLFQQQRVQLSQRMETIRQVQEQYRKGMEELDSNHQKQMASMQTELKKEMGALQKKVLTETQTQGLNTVRRSLQSMLEECS